MNIIQALDDANVFGQHFRTDTWTAWLAFLCALFALPMTDEQLALYRKFTGRNTPPATPLYEAWLVCGRRAGKSFVLAVIAVFLACFKDWRPYLGPGEVGTIMIIARDRRQSRVIRRFIGGLLQATPMLRRTIEDESVESIRLRYNVVIEIHTASFRSTRGYTVIAALLDEIALWPTDEESADPDAEIINSVRVGMATIPDAMLLCASSPHMRKGALWDAHRKHFGQDNDPVLVWQATSRDMNPTVPQKFIDERMADDPAKAEADFLAQFRRDLEGFVSRDVIAACTGDYFELAPADDKTYRGFIDAAGGDAGGGDSFTAAIAHRDGERVVVDCVREFRPPFSPEATIDELAALFGRYRIHRIKSDRWAGGFPPEQFKKRGIACEAIDRSKSLLYVDLLPVLNSQRIVLPRHERLLNQLLSLERRVVHGGHDTIDHPRGQHDDCANVVAGVAVLARKPGYDGWLDDESLDPAATDNWIRSIRTGLPAIG